MLTYYTATPDITSPDTSDRHLSKFGNGQKCRFRWLLFKFLWRGVLPAPPIGGLSYCDLSEGMETVELDRYDETVAVVVSAIGSDYVILPFWGWNFRLQSRRIV